MVTNAELIAVIKARNEADAALREVRDALNGVGEAAEKNSGRFGGVQKALGDVAKVASGVLVAQAIPKITGGFSTAISAASNLEESMNAVNQVFGDSAGEVLAWGKENANALGLSQAAFNQLATPMGAMLKNAGLGMDVVTKSTTSLTERAADMASVFNTDVSEAIDAINAGLRGESNPLEKYGVSLSAAAVEARALADTGKTSAKALTDQEKALARISLIMEQTNDVAGDFRNTSNGAANSARIAAARQEELAASIGQKLMPVQLAMTRAKLKFLETLNVLIPVVGQFVGVISTIAGALQPIVTNMDIMLPVLAAIGASVLSAVIPALIAMVPVWIANATAAGAAAVAFIAANAPLILIGAGIALVAAGIVLLVRHWDDITAKFPALGAAADGVKGALQAFSGWVTDTLVPAVVGAFDGIKGVLDGFVGWVTDTLVPAAVTAFDGVKAAIQAVIDFVGEHWGTIQAVIEPVFDAVRLVAESTFKTIETVIDTTIGVISGLFQVAKGIFTGDWGAIKDGVIEVVTSLKDGVLGIFTNLFDLITDLVPIAAGAALDLAQAIGRGLEAGVKVGVNAFIGIIEGGINVALDGIATGVSAMKRVLDAVPGPNPLGNTLQNAIDNLHRGISIPRLARGTSAFPGGLAIVGEEGPELVAMPSGSRVYPAGETRQMLGRGMHVTVNISAIDAKGVERLFREQAPALVGAIEREWRRRVPA